MNRNNAVISLFTRICGGSVLLFLLTLRPRFSHAFQPLAGNVNVKSPLMQYVSNSRSGVHLREVFATGLYTAVGSDSETQNIQIPFDGSEDRFDRWRFLQNFLEGDHPSSDIVNIVLYRVLDGALKYPRPSGGSDTLGSEETEEMTAEVKEKIREILSDYSVEGRVNAVVTMCDDDGDNGEAKKSALAILDQIESVLPDPVENEEDYKSLWDTIIELHGRESVKFHQSQDPVSLDWKVANTVTRVLLHFDFLTLGIVDAPLL